MTASVAIFVVHHNMRLLLAGLPLAQFMLSFGMLKFNLNILLALMFVLNTTVSHAQKNVITKDNVDRILKTLSADDKLGRSAMEPVAMERSIAFIEGEFKRIGLKPLDGLKSFRQEFNHDMISGLDVTLSVNEKKISEKDVVVYSSRQSLQWTLPVVVNRIKKTDNAMQLFRRSLQDSTDAVVLVDTAHVKTFNALRSRFARKRILTPASKSGSKVFILTADTILSSLNLQASQKIEKLKMTNVTGQIKASKETKESVVFSGHYDHLGIQPAVEGDSIANGADDDASGTTAVIVLADHFKKQKDLKRNLIFVAFTAEEIGGYGARYFSSNLNPTDVVAMFNIEMIGKLSKWGANAAFITGFERSDFGTILQGNLTGSTFTFHPDPYISQNLFYRSDNATLARLGVPAHTISTDQIDTDKLYHTVNDEFETIDTGNMTEIIRAIAMSASSIVKGDVRPTRIDTSKVE